MCRVMIRNRAKVTIKLLKVTAYSYTHAFIKTLISHYHGDGWHSCALPTFTSVLSLKNIYLTVILTLSICTKVGAGRLE